MPTNDGTTTPNSSPTTPPSESGEQLSWQGRFEFQDYNAPQNTGGTQATTLVTVLSGSAQTGMTAVRNANTDSNPDPDPENTGIGGMIEQALGSFWDGTKIATRAVGDGLNFLTDGWLYGPYGGTTILVAAGVGLGVLGFWLASRGSSSSTLSKPTTPAVATAAQSQLHAALDQAAGQAIAAGGDPTTVQTQRSMVELTYGTPLAATIRGNAPVNLAASLQKNSGRTVVTSLTSPTHYQSLSKLNTVLYLHSLSQSQTPNTITENSAVVHGANVQHQ